MKTAPQPKASAAPGSDRGAACAARSFLPAPRAAAADPRTCKLPPRAHELARAVEKTFQVRSAAPPVDGTPAKGQEAGRGAAQARPGRGEEAVERGERRPTCCPTRIPGPGGLPLPAPPPPARPRRGLHRPPATSAARRWPRPPPPRRLRCSSPVRKHTQPTRGAAGTLLGATLTSEGVGESQSRAAGRGRWRFYPLASAVSLQNGGRGRALTSRPFPSPVPSRHASGGAGGQRGRGWAGPSASLPPPRPRRGAPPIRAQDRAAPAQSARRDLRGTFCRAVPPLRAEPAQRSHWPENIGSPSYRVGQSAGLSAYACAPTRADQCAGRCAGAGREGEVAKSAKGRAEAGVEHPSPSGTGSGTASPSPPPAQHGGTARGTPLRAAGWYGPRRCIPTRWRRWA